MLVQLARRPFPLDPLIAEAKGRARRRRWLVVAALVATAVVIAFGLRPGGGPGALWHRLAAGRQQITLQQLASKQWMQRDVRLAGTFFRDLHPTVTAFETVPLANGTPTDVIRLRGNFSYTPSCIVGRSGPNGRCPPPAHFGIAEVEVNAASHRFMTETTGAGLLAIERARHASPLFGIFPDFPPATPVRCSIPRGDGGSVDGVCTAAGGPRGASFTERWPFSKPSGTRTSATWDVRLSRTGRVLSIERTGATPPQDW